MSHFIIVGKRFSALIEKILERRDTFTLLQDISTMKFPDKKLKNRLVTDFSSKKSLYKSLEYLPTKPDGVIATYENYILPAAWIANKLNLPGLPLDAAEACTDKELMRKLFTKAPEKISPDFSVVQSEESLHDFAAQHEFPLILKPANLAKSLLVTKNSNLEELILNYRNSVKLIETTYRKYAPNRTPKLIIEEFLEGSIHSVDAFVDSDGNPEVLEQIVDYQTGYDIGYDDNFHYSRLLPSKLSQEDQTELRHCAEVGIRALNIKNSPAHVEIIMTKSGPRVVEIGARNGGYRERMHGLANGIDILGTALDIACGNKTDIQSGRNDSCAVIELFPKMPGKFKRISHEGILRSLPSFKYLSVKANYGQFVGKSSEGYKMCAILILHNSNATQFNKDLAFVNNDIYVETISSK